MLEAQTSTAEVEDQNSLEDAVKHKEAMLEFLYGEKEIPFISIFKDAFLAGMFEDLGDLEQLKKNNPTYSSYIDRLLAKSINLKFVKVLEDGKIEVDSNLLKVRANNGVNKDPKNMISTRNNIQTIVKQAAGQVIDGSERLATLNLIHIEDNKALAKELSEAYNTFYSKLKEIVERSRVAENNDPSKLIYVGLTSCTIKKEVFNDL